MKDELNNTDENRRIGFKTQQEVIKQKLNYFTQATLKDGAEEKSEKQVGITDNE